MIVSHDDQVGSEHRVAGTSGGRGSIGIEANVAAKSRRELVFEPFVPAQDDKIDEEKKNKGVCKDGDQWTILSIPSSTVNAEEGKQHVSKDDHATCRWRRKGTSRIPSNIPARNFG